MSDENGSGRRGQESWGQGNSNVIMYIVVALGAVAFICYLFLGTTDNSMSEYDFQRLLEITKRAEPHGPLIDKDASIMVKKTGEDKIYIYSNLRNVYCGPEKYRLTV
ncbi:MAG: hypothetical protein ACI9G1_000867, partial [Pirellulaceae bacterium]